MEVGRRGNRAEKRGSWWIGDGFMVVPHEARGPVSKAASVTVEKEGWTIGGFQTSTLIPDWVAKMLAERGCSVVE